MNRLTGYLTATEWTNINEMIAAADPRLQAWFEGFKKTVVDDGILTTDQIDGVKDYFVEATFTFKIPMKARDKSHAAELFDEISFDPDYTLDRGHVICGEFQTSTIHLGSPF